MITRLLTGVFFVATMCIGTAQANDEKRCAEKYSFEEQLIVEWAALGGDPHAQFAITECAFPKGAKDLTADEKTYAVQWLTLASCEILDDEKNAKRDTRMRRLKANSELSFRRFGGMAKNEKMETRDKLFLQYRQRKASELRSRYRKMTKKISEEERLAANDALVNRFSQMGELGLLKLATLSDCKHFDASPEFKAASWSAAQKVWGQSTLSGVYGKSEEKGWSIATESQKHLASLDASAKARVARHEATLTRTSSVAIAELEEKAALADLQKLSAVHAHAGANGATTQSVTLALQYALESLDMMQFVNGPDNDYGPSTIDAVKKLQASMGKQETRWLSHSEIRDTICRAAVEESDPVSLFNVAMMYANGWGFKKDLSKAKAAIAAADASITSHLSDADELPAWKQERYPQYVSQIDIQKSEINSAFNGLPDDLKVTVSTADICSPASTSAQFALDASHQ